MKALIFFLIVYANILAKDFFEFKPITPEFTGVISNGKQWIAYGKNGVIYKGENKNFELKSLSYYYHINKMVSFNDTLYALLSSGELLYSVNFGDSWLNQNNFKQFGRDFYINDKYFIVFNDESINLINRYNFSKKDILLSKDEKILNLNNIYNLFHKDTLFIYTYTNKINTGQLKYLSLNQEVNSLEVLPVCEQCEFTKKVNLLHSYNNQKYIISPKSVAKFHKDTFEIVFTENKIMKLVNDNKNIYVINANEDFLYNNNALKINKLNKEFQTIDSFLSMYYKESQSYYAYEPKFVAVNDSLIVGASLSGSLFTLSNFKDFDLIVRASDINEALIDSTISLLISRTGFGYTTKDFKRYSPPTSKDRDSLPIPLDITFTLIDENNLNSYFFSTLLNKFNTVISNDTLKSYKYYQESFINSSSKGVKYIGNYNNTPVIIANDKLLSVEYSKLALIDINNPGKNIYYDTSTFYLNAIINNKEAFIVEKPKYSNNEVFIFKLNLSSKSKEILFNTNLNYDNISSYFIGSKQDSVLFIAYNNASIGSKSKYLTLIADLNNGKSFVNDSGESVNYPKNFFKIKNGNSFISGFNYLKELETNSKVIFTDNRHFTPKINSKNILQYCLMYSDTILGTNFLLTPKSTTSIESPQIEESAYLYTNPPRPNPATQSVSAEVYWNSAYTLSESNISVYDIYGSKYNSNITFTSKEPFRAIINADCSSLATGIYFIRISVNGEYKTIPFTVVK